MANSLLSPTVITREALRILRNQLNFVGSINRTYDGAFAKSGAKIGTTLNIRKPNEFTVRTGRVADVQDVSEQTVPLTLNTQKGVDMSFSSVDLTLTIDDFSQRYIRPAMARLATQMESDAISTMYKLVPQQVLQTGALTYDNVLEAGQILDEHLAPSIDRIANVNPQQNRDLVNGTSTLFNHQGELGRQYLTGKMGEAAGFEFYRNTVLPRHATGAAAGYLINGANQQAASLTSPADTMTLVVDTGTGSWNEGDVLTIAGVFDVNPESKSVTARLKQFVVRTATTGNTTSLVVSPAIVPSGAKQNVSAVPADNAAITRSGAASSYTSMGLAYGKDAFAFVSADLEMPNGVDWKARETLDGMSMRAVRSWDVVNDMWITRLDVLYGFAAIRPELAVRLASNQIAI